MKKDEHLNVQFRFVSRKGVLDENIEAMANTDNGISLIFVGKKDVGLLA